MKKIEPCPFKEGHTASWFYERNWPFGIPFIFVVCHVCREMKHMGYAAQHGVQSDRASSQAQEPISDQPKI